MLRIPTFWSAIALSTLFAHAAQAHVERIVHEPMKITRRSLSFITESNPDPLARRDETSTNPEAESSSWPVSYRVAIALDAFVIIVTLAALFVLAIYIRKQYRRRKLLALMRDDVNVDEEVGGRGNVRLQRRKTGSGNSSGSASGSRSGSRGVNPNASLIEVWEEKRGHQRAWSEDSEWDSKFGNRTSVVSFGPAGSSYSPLEGGK